MNTANIDKKIVELKEIANAKSELETREKELRAAIMASMEASDFPTYTSPIGTVSIKTKTSVKWDDDEMVIKQLPADLKKLYTTKIPAHMELNPAFIDAIKHDEIKIDGVTVETTKFTQINYVKNVDA